MWAHTSSSQFLAHYNLSNPHKMGQLRVLFKKCLSLLITYTGQNLVIAYTVQNPIMKVHVHSSMCLAICQLTIMSLNVQLVHTSLHHKRTAMHSIVSTQTISYCLHNGGCLIA